MRFWRRKQTSTSAARDHLNPPFSEPQSDLDSLLRDWFCRVVEREGPITLDVTDLIWPDRTQRVPGVIQWNYGAWVGDELVRNSGEPVPPEKIDRLEVTISFKEEMAT